MQRSLLLAAILGLIAAALTFSWMAQGGVAEPSLFIAEPSDCVVGLDEPRRLTNPARIDYPRVLEQTPPMREMRAKRLSPDSAEGIILRARADRLVVDACAVVMARLGHDSVWKKIRRIDGRPIPDLTRPVLARIAPDEPEPSAPER